MLHYKFPKIETLDDVLPAIKGRDEFIVADRGDFIVCNYAVRTDTTFDLIGPEDRNGLIRRECRGIKFYPDGRIMARPFHKFFNVNEMEETQQNQINLNNGYPFLITKKMDGSMVHPVVMKSGNIRWATKMGITDVSMQAEEFIAENCRYQLFAEVCVYYNWTPIFEWISPDNKIVIKYPNSNMVLLAIRENVSGVYRNIHSGV